MDGVTVTLVEGDWDMELAGSGQTELQVGLYDGTRRFPFCERAPGLCLSGTRQGSNTIAGSFVAQELEPSGRGYSSGGRFCPAV
jgi:hypothetical protein